MSLGVDDDDVAKKYGIGKLGKERRKFPRKRYAMTHTPPLSQHAAEGKRRIFGNMYYRVSQLSDTYS